MQQTLEKDVSYVGTGLHTGKDVEMILHPAECDTGIVFLRTDIKPTVQIEAKPSNVVNTMFCTTLGTGDVRINTVEHVLAALRGMGIDNAVVELNAKETPVGDGSSRDFVQLIKKAGIMRQNKTRNVLTIAKPLWATLKSAKGSDKYIIALPFKGFKISFAFISSHNALDTEYGEWTIVPDVFESEIAPARTVGFLEAFEALKKRGLALGGSFDVAVVVGEDKILTPLRYDNEIVRHKVLDVVGDFATLGAVNAHIIAVKSGHALNNKLACLIEEEYCYGEEKDIKLEIL